MYGNNFFSPHLKGSYFLTTGKNLSYFTPNSKLLLHFLLDFGLDGYFVSLWEDW